MSEQTTSINGIGVKSIIALFKQAIKGEAQDFTSGSIRRAVFLLAVPMILEMCMESIFAVVDIYFVGQSGGSSPVSTIVLTESVLTIVYSLAIGLSMAATAMVARRIGEKNPDAAAKSGIQAILLSVMITVVISVIGLVFAPQILQVMGASAKTIEVGTSYTRITFGGSMVIILLFLINGIFRGAGDASLAMRSLIVANICNIILDPLLILGFGPIPAMGVTGAAIATTTGRGIGVLYQLYHLFAGKRIIKLKTEHLAPDWPMIKSVFNIAWTGTAQFLIGSASWIIMARIVAEFGDNAVAGYGVAIRLLIFFLLPAWGMSNAAATLVGQNLGAKQPDRAEKSVWATAKYNTIFLVLVTLFCLLLAQPIIEFINKDSNITSYAIQALQVMCVGYIFYGVGMVVTNAFNGAGDTRTPMFINIVGFWLIQIPLGLLLALWFELGPKGVFLSIVLSETAITIGGVIIFRKGRWKKVQV